MYQCSPILRCVPSVCSFSMCCCAGNPTHSLYSWRHSLSIHRTSNMACSFLCCYIGSNFLFFCWTLTSVSSLFICIVTWSFYLFFCLDFYWSRMTLVIPLLMPDFGACSFDACSWCWIWVWCLCYEVEFVYNVLLINNLGSWGDFGAGFEIDACCYMNQLMIGSSAKYWWFTNHFHANIYFCFSEIKFFWNFIS